MARALHRDVGLAYDGAGGNCPRRNQALGEIFPVDQFTLAERALRQRLAARRFHFADAGDQRLELFRLEAGGVIGTFHLAVKRDVTLDHDRTQSNRADRYRDAALVA